MVLEAILLRHECYGRILDYFGKNDAKLSKLFIIQSVINWPMYCGK
jgi:hypothetical protein